MARGSPPSQAQLGPHHAHVQLTGKATSCAHPLKGPDEGGREGHCTGITLLRAVGNGFQMGYRTAQTL